MKFKEIISDGSPKGVAVGLIHTALIIVAYFSPLWLSWKVIGVAVLLLSGQFLIFGYCILNPSQYGSKDGRLYQNILTQLGIGFEEKQLQFILNWIIPITIFAISLILQLLLSLDPIINP